MQVQSEQRFDLSGGVQDATNQFMRAPNEVEDVVNGRFDIKIGSITRRNGYVQSTDTLEAGKDSLGLHTAKFSTGDKMLAAVNNAGDTATVIKSASGSTWSNLTLPGALPENTEVQFADSLDELYVAGIDDAGDRMSIINIKNDLTTSITRNLIGAPKARFITEFGGSLYAMNVEVGSTAYPNRAYKSSPALSVVTFTRGAQNILTTMAVDSVRYLKAAMAIDIYDHTTGTVRYSNVTIASVDKGEDTITLPARSGSLTFTAATTDLLTVASTANYPTGTAITVSSTTTLPAPLVVNTTYYVINVSGTTMKLATTAANATAGTAIDITSTGSGTHTANLLYMVGDNDEVYLTGRKGELCYLWNTDYPTEDKADYLKIPSGFGSGEIIGFGRSNDRLMIFTPTSMHRWDRSRLITRYEDIGCANHDTIVNIGDWLLWLDLDGRVNAYNDSTGQHEFISKAVKTKYFSDLTASNIANATASKVDNIYKLALGLVDGVYRRVCYDFDSNNWTRENHTRAMMKYTTNSLSGARKLYFMDDTGKLFMDDTGNLDDTATIPFRVKMGRDNSGVPRNKDYTGWEIFGDNLAGAQLRCYVDGKPDPIELGSLTGNISTVKVGNKSVKGYDVNIELAINSKGKPPQIDGYVPYFSVMERHIG